MVIDVGESVHVMERRLFEADVRRHFVGRVVAVGDASMRVEGFTFVFNANGDLYERMDDRRTRVFPLADAALVINVLAPDIELSDVHYRRNAQNDLVVSDGKGLAMRISEFGTHY